MNKLITEFLGSKEAWCVSVQVSGIDGVLSYSHCSSFSCLLPGLS